MLLITSITAFYVIAVWLVFFKFRWLRFNIVWGILSFWVGVHLLIVFVIALRFFQPYSVDAHIIRSTIQIVPRLPEPTILTHVFVEPNTPVKKGERLYGFDQTIFSARVKEQEAALKEANQNVLILQADIEEAQQAIVRAKAQLDFGEVQKRRFEDLTKQGGAKQENLDRWTDEVISRAAAVKEAEANLTKAQSAYASQIDGVNTKVIEAQARLDQAKYYLEQTTIYAPADGFIVNQQAQPGLVVGDRRIGAIAVFVTNETPYILASYHQEHLKLVRPGQPVEIALDLYPGQIFKGSVRTVWWATGQGQIKPSGGVPNFLLPKLPGRFAVQIDFSDTEKYRLPAGAHGSVAIYTGEGKGFEVLRRIGIRIYSWANFILPLPI
jgi:multidrug resistance efflux pump